MEERVKIPWEDWKLVKSIGKGGFGEVWEIERVKHGITEKAAIKVISIPQGDDEIECLQIEGYTDESITQRFNAFVDDIIKEYGMMVQMKGNTNIVYCDDYQAIQHEDDFGWDVYIKMELLTPLMKVVKTATQYRSSDRILIPDSTDPSLASQGYDVWDTWVDSDGVTHYYYCGWSAWSAWTFKAMEPSDPRKVQTRTVYQRRDYITDVTYSYWKWGEWAEWSFDPIEGAENTDAENRHVYRSRKATEVPLYYYYDWSDWSDWNFGEPSTSDQIEVDSRSVYRYSDRK